MYMSSSRDPGSSWSRIESGMVREQEGVQISG